MNTPFLHVIIQGVNKEYIFNNKKNIKKYMEIFNKNKEEYYFTLIAYCIMNNHAHFLVYVEDIKQFGKFMQKTNLNYAQLYNKENNRCGVLFRNRYQTEPIYNIKYLINCIKYIHSNPVKANMVAKCEDYEYSSYCDYVENKGLSQSKIMNDMFGARCNYVELFNESFDRRFMDIDYESNEDTNEYIIEGIRELKKIYKVKIVDILLNRDILKEIIFYLKEECKITYIEIQKFFGISKGEMRGLREM